MSPWPVAERSPGGRILDLGVAGGATARPLLPQATDICRLAGGECTAKARQLSRLCGCQDGDVPPKLPLCRAPCRYTRSSTFGFFSVAYESKKIFKIVHNGKIIERATTHVRSTVPNVRESNVPAGERLSVSTGCTQIIFGDELQASSLATCQYVFGYLTESSGRDHVHSHRAQQDTYRSTRWPPQIFPRS